MTDPNTAPNAAATATPASTPAPAAAAVPSVPKVKHKPGKTAIERSDWKRARAKALGQIK